MKIAFLLTQLEIGGAQVRVFQTAAAMRRMGHQVDVYFLYQKRPCFEDEPRIILSGEKRPGPAGILKAIGAFYKALRRERYDALFTNTAPANIIGNSIALLAGIKARIAYQTQPPQRLSRPVRLLDTLVGSIGVYKVNIVNSHWTAGCFAAYNRFYKRRLKLVYDGIAPRTSSETREAAKRHFGIAPDSFMIANIGRLSEQKDQKTLLSAMARVDGLLVIAGDGELKADLARQMENLGVADKVRFLGEVNGDEIALLLRAADVFAFSSRWETFGLALIEAAASGLPLVATNLPVSREVLGVEDDDSLSFVTPMDADGFAAALQRLRSDPALRETMAERSRTRARDFSIDRHATLLLELTQ